MSVYEILLLSWVGVAAAAFLGLFKINAGYGRYAQDSFGALFNARTGWIVMEMPALLVFPAIYFAGPAEKSFITDIFIFCWVFHYVNRVLIYPFRLSSGRNVSLEVIASAFFFNCVNGAFLGYYFGFMELDYAGWHLDFRFWLGLGVWVLGLSINWDADRTLLRLKRLNPNGYQVPHTRLFSYISSPNYFGEIIEHLGFAIMVWALPGWAFLIWTIANLLPRALAHRRWYRETFADYPPERKALIPFIL